MAPNLAFFDGRNAILGAIKRVQNLAGLILICDFERLATPGYQIGGKGRVGGECRPNPRVRVRGFGIWDSGFQLRGS